MSHMTTAFYSEETTNEGGRGEAIKPYDGTVLWPAYFHDASSSRGEGALVEGLKITNLCRSVEERDT